ASDEVHRTPLDELGAGDNTRVQIAERSTEPVRLSPTLVTHANREAPRWGRRIHEGPVEADELGVTAHLGVGRSARLGPCRTRHSGLWLSEGHGTHWSQPQLVEHVLGDTSRRNAVIVDLAEAPGMQTILQPLLQGLAVSSPRRQLLALLGAARLERR